MITVDGQVCTTRTVRTVNGIVESVRTRTWNQIVRAKRHRRVSFEIMSDQEDSIVFQHADGCHAPPQPDALLATANTIYKLYRAVRHNVTRDAALLTIVGNLRQHGADATGLTHLMINFEDGPCYEVICRSHRLEPAT